MLVIILILLTIMGASCLVVMRSLDDIKPLVLYIVVFCIGVGNLRPGYILYVVIVVGARVFRRMPVVDKDA